MPNYTKEELLEFAIKKLKFYKNLPIKDIIIHEDHTQLSIKISMGDPHE